MKRTAAFRLLAKRYIDEDTQCWNWTGQSNTTGYGKIVVNGKVWGVARLAAVLWLGFNNDERYVCHHCDNRLCFNPDHLFIGTQQDNLNDMVPKGRSLKDRYTHVHNRILTEHDVRQIRALRRQLGRTTLRDTARLFGVSHETIRMIENGRTWKHIK